MNTYKSNSAHDIVYIDHSSSGTGASMSQSSADPTSLANLMRKSLVIITPPQDLIVVVQNEKLDVGEKTKGKP